MVRSVWKRAFCWCRLKPTKAYHGHFCGYCGLFEFLCSELLELVFFSCFHLEFIISCFTFLLCPLVDLIHVFVLRVRVQPLWLSAPNVFHLSPVPHLAYLVPVAPVLLISFCLFISGFVLFPGVLGLPEFLHCFTRVLLLCIWVPATWQWGCELITFTKHSLFCTSSPPLHFGSSKPHKATTSLTEQA